MTRIILHFIWEKMRSRLLINSFLKAVETQELCKVSFLLFVQSKVFFIAKIQKIYHCKESTSLTVLLY